ncbi:10202_t:CDS:2, partial [Entrophospora sp. SA101]
NNGANVKLACNLRCIAHFVNLAIKSIIEQYKLIFEAAHEIWKSIDSCLKSEEIFLS